MSPARTTALPRFDAALADSLEDVAVPIHFVGRDGVILWANRAELAMLGYAPSEFVGRNIAEFHADAAVIADILERLNAGQTLRDHPARLRHKDGSVRDVILNCNVLRRDGEFIHTRCFTRDVTAERLGQLRLETGNSVTRILAHANSLQDASVEILKAICEQLRWQFGALWREDATVERLRCVHTWRSPDSPAAEFEALTRSVLFPSGSGLPGRVWATGKPAWIHDLLRDGNFPRAPVASKCGLHSGFGFPIRGGGRLLGMMEFFSHEIRQPEAELLEMFDGLGSQIGQFIERKEAEAAVRELSVERQLRASIVDSSEDAILAKNLDGIITSWNAAAEKMYGYTAAEAVGQHVKLLAPPERRHEIDGIMERIRRGQRVEHHETMRITKDGRHLTVSLSVSPIYDAAGAVVGASAIARDVTQRKLLEAALAEKQTWLTHLTESMPAMVWVASADGTQDKYFNRAWTEYTGLTHEQSAGGGWQETVHPQDRQRCFDLWKECAASGRIYETEMRYRGADGNYRWFLVRAVPARDPRGRIVEWFGTSVDIEEQKRTQQLLQQSERRSRVIAESSPAIMWKTSPAGDALYLNARWEEITGVPIAHALGQGWHQVIHPDDQTRCAATVRTAYASGEPYQVEVRYRCRGGTYRWFMVRSVPLMDGSGQITEWLGTSFDIHDRKIAEAERERLLAATEAAQAALKESEQRLQLASQAAGVGIFDWDMKTNQIVWSEQQHILLGLPPCNSTHTYDEWKRMVHPEDLARAEERARHAIAQRQDLTTEMRVTRPDGSVRWFASRGRIFYDHNQQPSRMLGVNEDVTERREAEEKLHSAHVELHRAHEELQAAHDRVRLINEELEDRVITRTEDLRRSEERYRELFENANDAIFTTDLTGRITSVNRAAEKITGYSRREFLQMNVEQIIPREDKERIMDKRAEKLRRGGVTQYQVMVIGKDGHNIPAEISTRLIMENGRPVGIQGIARDITERVQTENILRQVSARLMELRDEERRRFARELHDSTGQNLAALMMNLSVMASSNGSLDADTRRSIQESLALADSCAREIRTISYLLHPPLLDEMGLESALNWLADGFAERSGLSVAQTIRIGSIRLPPELELAVFRVVQEALTNIHRHSGSRTAEIHVSRSGGHIELSVIDQGRGIPGWKRGEPDWSRTGVGIAGMRERVALLGGRLDIDSGANGTTVTARLPLAKSAAAK